MYISQCIKTQLFTYTDPDTKETRVRFIYGFDKPPVATDNAPTLVSSKGRLIHRKTTVLITRGSPRQNSHSYLDTATTDGGSYSMHTRIAYTFIDKPDNVEDYDIDHRNRNRMDNNIENLLPRIKSLHRADKSNNAMDIKQNINIPIQVTFKTGKYANETRTYSSIKEASYDTDITISRAYIAELVHKHETMYSNYVVKRIETEIPGEQWLPAQVFTKTNELIDLSNFLCSNKGRFIEKRIGYAYFPQANAGKIYPTISKYLSHRITLSTFSPDTYFPGAHCLHKDDDKTQCSVDCLRWGTHQENMRDRIGKLAPKNPENANIPIIATHITTGQMIYFDDGAVEAAEYFKVDRTRISASKYGQKLFNEWTFQNNMDHDRTRYLPGELWLYDETCIGEAAAERRENKKRKRPDHYPPPQSKKNAATGHAQAEAIWSYVVNTRNDKPPEFSAETWTKHNGHMEAATAFDITRQNIGKAVNRATPTPNKSGTLYYYFVNGEHDVPERQPNKKPAHPRKGTMVWSIEVSHKKDHIPEFDPTRWKMHISKPAAAEALNITTKAVEGATNRSTPTPNADKTIYYYIVNANNDVVKPFLESVVYMEVS